MATEVDSTSTDAARGTSGQAGEQSASLLRRFLELVRFSHTIFALPFAALACVFAFSVSKETAEGVSTSSFVWMLRLVGVLVCMVSARSAAMAFNRLVDVEFDGSNPRTAIRHLAAGTLTAGQVWAFFAANCVVFLIGCGLFLPNWLPLALAVPVLVWICGYSLAKRFTSAAHLWLGVALALSPVCTWIALRGEIVVVRPLDLLPAVGLAAAIAFWVAGFDIIYACQDAEFDRKQRLHSIPSRLGVAGGLKVAAFFHFCMLLVLAAYPLAFPALNLGPIYFVSFLAVAFLIVRQHSIVRPDDLRRVNEAFFQINAIISFGFCFSAGLDSLLIAI